MKNSTYQDPETWYSELPTIYAAASMLITDGGGKILLVQPNYRDYWSLPGGTVDAGENPAECAARETREEVGLALTAGAPLAIAWEPAAGPRPKARISFYFAGGTVPDGQRLRIDESELAGAGFFSLADALPLLPATIAPHVSAAWQTRQGGQLAYLAEP